MIKNQNKQIKHPWFLMCLDNKIICMEKQCHWKYIGIVFKEMKHLSLMINLSKILMIVILGISSKMI